VNVTPKSEPKIPRVEAEPPVVAPPAALRKTSAAGTVVLALLVLAAMGGFVVYRALHRNEALQESVPENGGRTSVRVVSLRRANAEQALTLPGTALADQQTPLYARINGYLKSFAFDLGDSVKKGQLVAEIDSPEVDQQLRQARATLGVAQASLQQAQANQELARVASERWAALVKEKAVSQQEADEKRLALAAREADVESARATIKAQEANVKRLEELQSFKQILAPFDGVVTARYVEVGTLVSEGSGANARELFRMVQLQSLRFHVPVPESFVPSIKGGMTATLSFDAHPGKSFEGQVSRFSNAVDPASRTMLVEVRVPNPDGRLLPGMYAQVTFKLRQEAPALLMPSNALLVRPEGTLAALVGKDKVVHYKKVQVGRDYGTRIEILGGLQENDQVMVNPTTMIREGEQVEPTAQDGSP
jgi:RND family efflux transporter MFP subunit